MKTKLFFSGTIKPDGALSRFCSENGWELTAKSLIAFEAVAFELPDSFDVVFFSSPRSVYYFFSQKEINSSFVSACIGKGTAAALEGLNISPEFVGEKSGIPEKVATDFVEWLGERDVLFPVSSRSNETISKYVPVVQRKSIVCYNTLFVPELVEQQDVYVFTSPSNVASFLKVNNFPVDSRIISWGKSTDKKIVKTNNNSYFILEESSEDALVNLLIENKFTLMWDLR
jgi:uroporphyrinogen-III synthase